MIEACVQMGSVYNIWSIDLQLINVFTSKLSFVLQVMVFSMLEVCDLLIGASFSFFFFFFPVLLLQELTLIRSAHLLELFLSGDVFQLALAIVLRWSGLSLFDGTTFILSRNTKGTNLEPFFFGSLLYQIVTHFAGLFVSFINCCFHVFACFRYEKRHSNIPAHISPCFRVKEGDHVIIGQCR